MSLVLTFPSLSSFSLLMSSQNGPPSKSLLFTAPIFYDNSLGDLLIEVEILVPTLKPASRFRLNYDPHHVNC